MGRQAAHRRRGDQAGQLGTPVFHPLAGSSDGQRDRWSLEEAGVRAMTARHPARHLRFYQKSGVYLRKHAAGEVVTHLASQGH